MSEANAENNVEVNGKPTGNAEAAKYRRRAAELKARVAELESKLADLEIERDNALKAVESAPGEALARIAELEGVVRHRNHRNAFDKLAAGKIKSEALDDAFALSGWKVESDDVDENTMGEVITNLVEAKPYLRVQDPTPPVEESTTPAPAVRLFGPTGTKPVPVKGAGRGPAPTDSIKNTAYSF